jgi:hypothetical protein
MQKMLGNCQEIRNTGVGSLNPRFASEPKHINSILLECLNSMKNGKKIY